MRPRPSSFALAAAFALSSVAQADNAYDFWNGASYDWTQAESESQFPFTCHQMNNVFGTDLKCSIDHKSFDAHFAKEKKSKAEAAARDPNKPQAYCGELSIYYFWNGIYPFPKDCAQCVEEFKAKVKAVECRYDENLHAGTGSISLKNGTLTISVHEGIESSDWMAKALRKQLPAMDKWMTGHGG